MSDVTREDIEALKAIAEDYRRGSNYHSNPATEQAELDKATVCDRIASLLERLPMSADGKVVEHGENVIHRFDDGRTRVCSHNGHWCVCGEHVSDHYSTEEAAAHAHLAHEEAKRC